MTCRGLGLALARCLQKLVYSSIGARNAGVSYSASDVRALSSLKPNRAAHQATPPTHAGKHIHTMSTSNLEKGYGAFASGTETKPTSLLAPHAGRAAAYSVVVVGATAAYSAHGQDVQGHVSRITPGDCAVKGYGILGLDEP